MTVLDLEELIRQNYNALDDSFFTSSELYRLMYRAQKELAQKAFVIERKYTTTSTSGTAEYSFPSNAFSIARAEYNGVKLQKVSLREEDSVKLAAQNSTVTGTPKYYSIWNSTVRLTPTPDTSSVTITLYTYNYPQEVESTSSLEVPATFHDAIVDFALSYMYAKDGNINMAQYYRGLWQQALQEAVIWRAKYKRGDAPAQVQSEDILEGTILGVT